MAQRPRLWLDCHRLWLNRHRLWLTGHGYGSTATAMAQRPQLWLNGHGYGPTATPMAQPLRLWLNRHRLPLNGHVYGSTATAVAQQPALVRAAALQKVIARLSAAGGDAGTLQAKSDDELVKECTKGNRTRAYVRPDPHAHVHATSGHTAVQ